MMKVLDEHQAEMRRFIAANFDSVSRRIASEIKVGAPAAAHHELPPIAPREPAPRWPWAIAVVVAALVPACLLGYLYQETTDNQRQLIDADAQLTARLAEQGQQVASIQEALERLQRDERQNAIAATAPTPAATRIDVESVPYGEIPLAGQRLEKFRNLAERLRSSGFKGKLRVDSYAGDFCLAGTSADGFTLPQDDLPARRCDLVGNPFEDTLNPAQRQSVDFANYVATLRRSAGSSLQVELNFAGRSKPVVPYPTMSDRVTAGDWNRAAARNNRVEFTQVPAG
jgi:hypothetical protein